MHRLELDNSWWSRRALGLKFETHQIPNIASMLAQAPYITKRKGVITIWVSSSDILNHTKHFTKELTQLITPVIVTLQYFSAQKPIFSFERNAKNFIATVCILALIFPLLVVAMDLTLDFCTALTRAGLREKKRRAHSHNLDVELSHPDLLGLYNEPYSEKRRD